MTQVVEILPHVRQGHTLFDMYLVYIVNTMAVDVLATQGARASATMILTCLNRDNSVPARLGLNFLCESLVGIVANYNMTVWILARKEINFPMAAGLIRLHMPGVK